MIDHEQKLRVVHLEEHTRHLAGVEFARQLLHKWENVLAQRLLLLLKVEC